MASRRDAWRDGRLIWDRLRVWLDDAEVGATRGEEALNALSAVRELRNLLDYGELAAVRACRQDGLSWSEIAAQLGVTRQSAWERWRFLDEEVRERKPGVATEPQTTREAKGEAKLAAGQQWRRSAVPVPDVVGLIFDDARALVRQQGLEAVAPDPDGPPLGASGWPDGIVTGQSPDAGVTVPPGSSVTLWLGGGSAGVREPRRPAPGPRGLRAAQDEPASGSSTSDDLGHR